jgi:hypothetical protein
VRILPNFSHDTCHIQPLLLSYLVSDTQVPYSLVFRLSNQPDVARMMDEFLPSSWVLFSEGEEHVGQETVEWPTLLQQPLLELVALGGKGGGVLASLKSPAALQVLLTLCTASTGVARTAVQISRRVLVELYPQIIRAIRMCYGILNAVIHQSRAPEFLPYRCPFHDDLTSSI